MHVPPELYPMETALAEHFPHLRRAQVRGLALWVCGAILAHSACQSAVLAALLAHGGDHALRQRLREWLYDGADRAAPCAPRGSRSSAASRRCCAGCWFGGGATGAPWRSTRRCTATGSRRWW